MRVRWLSLCAAALVAEGAASLQGLAPQAAGLRLTPQQIETYKRDGVIVVRGLLRGEQLRAAMEYADQLLAQREQKVDSYRMIDFQGWRTSSVLRQIAFDSEAPALAAQLMRLTPETPLRVLKDAFLALNAGDKGCGWHVDDKFFWPCHDTPLDDVELDGVNVWITLSPLRASEGGGLAVAPTSFKAPWREDCRRVIAGKQGGGTGPPLTCGMAELSPSFNAKLEELKMLHDMQPGDAIFHSRYCFHRGEPFDMGDTKLRYSIRYAPATSKLFNNGFESALSAKGLQGGEDLSAAGEYYPQVWPTPVDRERLAIQLGKLAPENPFGK